MLTAASDSVYTAGNIAISSYVKIYDMLSNFGR